MSQHFVEAGFRIQFQRRVATALTHLRHTYRVGEGERNDNTRSQFKKILSTKLIQKC